MSPSIYISVALMDQRSQINWSWYQIAFQKGYSHLDTHPPTICWHFLVQLFL